MLSWFRGFNSRRWISFSIALVFSLQSVSAFGAPVPYRVQAEHFLTSLEPMSIWDQPSNSTPGEVSKQWAGAIRKYQDQLFSNHRSDIERAENFDLWIESLRNNAFYGVSANPQAAYYVNHPLDVFGLLGQTVHTKSVETNLSKVKRALRPVGDARRALVQGTRQAMKSWGEATASILLGGKQISASVDEARDVPAKPEPTMRRMPYFDYINMDRLVVEVVDSEGKLVKFFNLAGADMSILDRQLGAIQGVTNFHVSKASGVGPYSFRLSYQGQTLNDFQNNFTSVAVYNRYLVFIEPGRTFRDHKILNLSFIDLDFFQSAVGRTVLPIFRLPISVSDEALRDPGKLELEATSMGLKVDGRFINSEVFEFFSWMQQMVFNITASLTDDNFHESTSKVLGSMLEHFDVALDQTAKSLDEQLERAGVSFDMYQDFRKKIQEQLKVRADLGASSGGKPREVERSQSRMVVDSTREFDSEIDFDPNHVIEQIEKSNQGADEKTIAKNALAMLTKERVDRAKAEADVISKDVKAHLVRAEKFGKQIVADRSFQEAMRDQAAGISSVRKLTNRINAFWARLIMPQPLGAPKIQQALGLIAAGVSSIDTWKANGLQACAMTKEGLMELVANRRSRMALEVLTGAALCAVYPAETAQMAYQAVDLGRNLLSGFLGWMDNWVIISKTAWEASWSWLDWEKLSNTYLTKDNFHHLSVGVGALFGTLLATAGILHAVVNGHHYLKAMRAGDWKKERESGIGFWRSFRNTFVRYLSSDRKRYYDALSRSDKRRRGQDILVQLPDGGDFKGLFRSMQQNDFKALAESERNKTEFKLGITFPDGREVVAKAVKENAVSRPKRDSDITMKMELPDGSQITRILEPQEGDWNLVGNDEVMADGSVCELKLEKTSLVGALQSTEWTDAEEKMLSELLENLRRKDVAIAKRFESLKGLPIIGGMLSPKKGDIETMGHAIRHFIFGYSSWTHSTRLFGKIWNPWFLVRNFWIRPRTWFTMMAYPNLFNRMVWNNGVATTFDGGKREIGELHWLQRIKVAGAQAAGFEAEIIDLKAIEKFEKEIIPVEQVIHQAAMRQAFVHLIEVAARDPNLISLLKEGGKVHPFDSRFKRLDKELRLYFEAYFVKLFDDSLRTHIMAKMGMDPARPLMDGSVKEAAASFEGSFEIKDSEADELVRQVAVSNGVSAYAKKVASGGSQTRGERRRIDHWRKVGQALDANFNGSLKRYKLAETQMNNEEAMARATRQFMVGLVVDKPIELLFTFLFLAGIDEGILKPLHEEKFSENSAFYLSRYVFWNGYFVGIMISLLAEVWMKIQMDARVDALGGFGNAPSKEEYDAGFLRYYKSKFNAPDNKWWDNQKFEMTIAFVNMPAYFVTAMVTNLAFLGRFDLDSFLAVYKSSLLPTGGLAYKLENAFEMSADYVVGAIPAKFHSDPRVQEFRNQRIGRLRLGYNFVYKTFYENPLGNILGNWEAIPVPGIGPRAWVRQFYGGFLPTEVIANNVLRPVEGMNIVGLSDFADACDRLLTTNHTDAVKLIPKPTGR